MKHSSHDSLSTRIRLERTKRSWTQEHLADQAKLSSRTIQRIENGGEPSKEALRAIADAFSIKVEDLLNSVIRRDYGAPWDNKVKVISLAISLMLIVVTVTLNNVYSIFPVGLLIVCLFFTIHGYSLRDDQLLIHRLGWSNKYPLKELTEMEVNPQAMVGSIRVFGNGGLFGYSGYFRNTILGKYRAFVTNSQNCLILRFSDKRIVISPDNPREMESAIESWLSKSL